MTLPDPYYQHNNITIYHADARDIIPQLSNIQSVVTSPPYNQFGAEMTNRTGHWATSGWADKWVDNGYPDIRNEIEYQADQLRLFTTTSTITTPTASLFYNHQLRWRNQQLLHPIQWFQPDGWNLRQEIIWARSGGMMMNARMFVRTDERILWFVKPNGWEWNQESVGHGTVWRMNQGGTTDHPVAFPIGLPTRCIEATTQPGDIVLDPYMGSGTTLVAAQKLGRHAIGIDTEERYCEIATNQLAQQTLTL